MAVPARATGIAVAVGVLAGVAACSRGGSPGTGVPPDPAASVAAPGRTTPPGVADRSPATAPQAGPAAANLPSRSISRGPADAVPDGRDPFRAVDAAVDWLARHQAEDGSWGRWRIGPGCGAAFCTGGDGAGDVLGSTAMAVTSLGARAWERRRAGVIRAGVAYLLSRQAPDGTFDARPAADRVRNQAMAAVALCRSLEGGTGPAHRAGARRALAGLLSMRTPGAAWSDGGDDALRDLRVTTWATMALAGAVDVDVPIPGAVHREVLTWLDSYPGGRTEAAASMRTCCRVLCGATRRDARLIADHALLLDAGAVGNGRESAPDPESVYFATVAAYLWGGEVWMRRRALNAGVVLPRQRGAGSGCRAGSWDPHLAKGSEGDRVATTVFLSLLFDSIFVSTYRNARADEPVIPK